MIDVRKVLTLLACCCLCLTVATTTLADFVGVVVENKTDPDTVAVCGAMDPPLTICNVSIQFGDDNDRLLSMAFSNLQVMGSPGALFHQDDFTGDLPYFCSLLPAIPSLQCDSYVAIGQKCNPQVDTTQTEGDFDSDAFNFEGLLLGGWFNATPTNGQGDAFSDVNPDGIVFVLQTSVALGLSVEGTTTVFWHNIGDPEVFENQVDIVCEAKCIAGVPCDDLDPCTSPVGECIDGTCVAEPIVCDDDNECTDDACDGGCVFTNNNNDCDDGDPCTASSTCSNGTCSGDPECVGDADCDDGNMCTADVCEATGCCSNTDTTDQCNDNDPCTDDGCDPGSGCTNVPECTDAGDCDDGDNCTVDTCEGTCCTHTPVDCLPGEVCDPGSGDCIEIPCVLDSDCEDDGNECTDTVCEGGLCVFPPLTGAACGDSSDSDCDGADTCDDAGNCQDNIADAGAACSGNGETPCSGADTCDGAGSCDNNDTADGGPCDDGSACTENDTCSGGSCSGDDPCPEDLTCVEVPGGFECQAFIAGSLDIIPGKCPNRLRRNGLGFLKVSLVSTDDVDACAVDASTCVLSRADGEGGTATPRMNPAPRCRDRATPFEGELCGCHNRRKDGIDDLDMRFKVADVVNNLGLADMAAGVSVELVLECQTDGAPVRASDCVELGRDLGPNP